MKKYIVISGAAATAIANAKALSKESIKYIVLSATESANLKGWHEIAIVGEWKGHHNGEFKLTLEDLNTIKTNFDNMGVELPVDMEHASLYGDKAEAYGWVKELKVENEKLYARIEWLDDAKELIESKKYRYLSPVLIPNTIDRVTANNIGWSLHSVALTNRPFLEELDEIRLNQKQQDQSQKKENDMGEEEKQKLLDEIATLKADKQKLLDEIDSLKKANGEASDAVANSRVDAAIAAGKLSPDQKEAMMAFAKADGAGFEKLMETMVSKTPQNNQFEFDRGNGGDQVDVLKELEDEE